MKTAALARSVGTAPGNAPTPTWRTVAAMARVEAGRLVRHPAVLAGLALSVLWLRNYFRAWIPVLHRDDLGTAPALFPLAAMTLIVASLSVLRPRTDGSEELYESFPVDDRTRTVAHLLAVAGAAALGAVIVAGWVALTATVIDGVGRPHPAELATGPLLVFCAGVLGVALARWVPIRQAGPLAVVALAAIQIALNGRSDVVRSLAPWVPPAGDDLFLMHDLPRELMVRRPAVHLAYLAGLALLAAGAALLRHRARRERSLAVVGAALALVVATVWAQSRPPSPTETAALVDAIEHPETVQECEQRGTVRYCAFPAYTELVDHWAEVVEGTLAPVPDAVRTRPLDVRQRAPFDVALLPPEVEARLTFRPSNQRDRLISRGDDRAVHPEMRWGRGPDRGVSQLGLAVPVASWALGLPMEGPAGGSPCMVSGQARTVVALWLAGQATPDAQGALRRILSQSGQTVFFRGVRVLGGLGTTPVIWDERDVRDALELLERPRHEIADLLRAEWDWIADPATSSEVLASRLGLTPRDPPGSARPRGRGTCR